MPSLLFVVLAATPGDCRAAYRDVRYSDAASVCREALKVAAPQERAELYRLLGLALASTGDHPGAQAAFTSLLTLDSAATLSSEYAPRVRADFDAARAAGAGSPVKLELVTQPSAFVGEAITIGVKLDDGKAEPVRTLIARDGENTQPLERTATQFSIAPSNAVGSRQVEVNAIDALGGTLAMTAANIAVVERPKRSVLLAWPLWGGVSLGTLAGGSVLGVLSRTTHTAASNAMFADDTLRLQRQGNDFAITADVLFGVAGALAITALVLALTAN